MTSPGTPADEPDDDRPDNDRPDPDRLGDPAAVEAAFDAIVANIETDHGTTGTPWPDAENASPTHAPEEPPAGPPSRTPRADWTGWDDVRPLEPASTEGESPDELDELDELDDDEDEHYVPPPPPPVPRGDRVVRWAWAGAVGAPLTAVVLPVIGWPIDGLIGFLLVIAFLAGFITLISRLRPGPRVDDGPDDGAIV